MAKKTKKGDLRFNVKANRIINAKGQFVYNSSINYSERFKTKKDFRLAEKFIYIGTTKKLSKKEKEETIKKVQSKKYDFYKNYLHPTTERTKEHEGKMFDKTTGKYKQITLTGKDLLKNMSEEQRNKYIITNIRTWIIMIHEKLSPIYFNHPTGFKYGERTFGIMANNFGADILIEDIDNALDKGYFFELFSCTYKVYNKLYKTYDKHKVLSSYSSFKSYYRTHS